MDLISWLPESSPFVASVRGGREYLGWTWDRIMLTLLLESTQQNGFNFIKANTDPKKSRNLRSPDPIDFPGRPKRKPSRGSFGPIVKQLAQGQAPPDLR